MTKKEFLNKIANGREDILMQFLDILKKLNTDYCVIGGLAVNAYVEPVVSLDLDVVVVSRKIDALIEHAKNAFKIVRFLHSVNLCSKNSDLRIQLQTDPRYQVFLKKAALKNLMGYRMRVASVEDVLQGKIWAYSDPERRPSKRQKDLADIYRIIEKYPRLKRILPDSIKIAD
jgi:hypothetical protein